jgi:hypothetical protein
MTGKVRYHEMNGVKKTLKEWAADYSMCFDTVNTRIYNLKWELEKALTEPVRKRYFCIDGVDHTIGEWCAIYDVPRAKVQNRITRGWEIEEALTFNMDGSDKARRSKVRLASNITAMNVSYDKIMTVPLNDFGVKY